MARVQVIEKTLFTFDELSDEAKEKAREWWREIEAQDWNGAECVFEDACAVAPILGIEFDTRPVKLMGGGTRHDPIVYYSGFWSQGDGACFEGSYGYAKGASKAIREYAPQDKTLHAIADGLQRVQKDHFYKLVARMTHSGHYYNSGCMTVAVEDDRDSYRDIGESEELIKCLVRNFADWIYSRLRDEYEYTMTDENVDEAIRINEYEFDESGRIS